MNTFISLCALASFLLLLLSVKPAESIRCWVCSSDYESRCDDPFNLSQAALTNCDLERTQSSYLQSRAVCKKMKERNRNGDLVTVRSCNWVSEDSRDGHCLDQATHYNTKIEYCSTCTHDACNHASGLSFSLAALLPVGAVLMRSIGKNM